MTETPAQDVVPKTTTVTVLGRDFEVNELVALDIADVEDKAGKSMGEILTEMREGKYRIALALAIIWVLVRKSKLTPEEVVARKWAISWDEIQLIPYQEIVPLVQAVSPFFSGSKEPDSDEPSSSQPAG